MARCVLECIYDVFLSFRGADTRKTFTKHLYTALVDASLRTFIDDNEIESGENINSELEKAIQQSKSSIIVFSKNYASSRWCLDELVLILERKRTKGLSILPIFYCVDPVQVKNQTGSYGKALAKHEKRFNQETGDRKKELINKVEGWKEALKEVADLGGMVLRNQSDKSQLKFIQKVVKVIEDKVNRTILSISPYLVGINSRVKNINLWLQNGSTDISVVAISGMSGIGKTTISKYVFSLNFERFEASSFLENVGEIFKKQNGLVYLQRKFLSDIHKGKGTKINGIHEGIIRIKEAVRNKRVLLVLDDVDHSDQLDAIFGMRDLFHPGCKIIITTRYAQLLNAHEFYSIYDVEKMDIDESYELFSYHAFGQDCPNDDFIETSEKIVKHCDGLPLALQVLGSSLRGKTIDVWKSAIKKLEAIPNSRILKKLKLSYDSLQDDHDKRLFLEIACFFTGKNKDFMVAVLDECDFYTTIGIQNLMDRCLLILDQENKLAMHQMVRDMGREIIRLESPKDPGKRSRLWHYKDSFSVLRENTGTVTVEGLVLDMNTLKADKSAMEILTSNNAKGRRFEGFNGKSLLPGTSNSVKRRRFGFFSWYTVANSDEVYFKTDAFTMMHKLRLLQINYVQLIGGYKEFPKELRWLCWRGFPLKSLPTDLLMENIVAIDMRHSSLEQVWTGIRFLRSLKILNLSHSLGLSRTPDFVELPHLERLILKNCVCLSEVDESIGNLKTSLVFLNLKDCKNLRKLPRNICMLKVLETLNISGCSNLEELPTDLSKMESLKDLSADGIPINQLSSTTKENASWHAVIWSWLSRPRRCPELTLASLPQSLVTLSLESCSLSDDAFPRDFTNLCSLQNLNLNQNPICYLPDCVKGLTLLQTLGLHSCTMLEELTGLPSINNLFVGNCTSLEKIAFRSNSTRASLYYLAGCKKLVEMEANFKLEPINEETIKYLGLHNVESIGSIDQKMYNCATHTKRTGPIQVLYEYGGISIFFSGSKAPSWFSIRSEELALSFVVPSFSNHKIRGLNVCSVYSINHQHWNRGVKFYSLEISNKTKDLKKFYSPTWYGFPNADEGMAYRPAWYSFLKPADDMIWFSHWRFENDELEAGDELNVSLRMVEAFFVKEIAVHFVYEDQEQVSSSSSGQEVVQKTDFSQHTILAKASAYRGTRVIWQGHWACN